MIIIHGFGVENMEEIYTCVIPSCKKNITEKDMVKIGISPICYDHFKKDGLKIMTFTDDMIYQYLSLIKEKKENGLLSSDEVKKLHQQIQQLSDEKVALQKIIETKEIQHAELTKLHDIKTLYPDFENIRNEITNVRNDLVFVKSEIMNKNHEGIMRPYQKSPISKMLLKRINQLPS
jgi:hypothetical protein